MTGGLTQTAWEQRGGNPAWGPSAVPLVLRGVGRQHLWKSPTPQLPLLWCPPHCRNLPGVSNKKLDPMPAASFLLPQSRQGALELGDSPQGPWSFKKRCRTQGFHPWCAPETMRRSSCPRWAWGSPCRSVVFEVMCFGALEIQSWVFPFLLYSAHLLLKVHECIFFSFF